MSSKEFSKQNRRYLGRYGAYLMHCNTRPDGKESSSENFPAVEDLYDESHGVLSSSSYSLAPDRSQQSEDVDLWIRGNGTPSEGSATQETRLLTTNQRQQVTSSESGGDLWYLFAMCLALFRLNSVQVPWRCRPEPEKDNSSEFIDIGHKCNSNIWQFEYPQRKALTLSFLGSIESFIAKISRLCLHIRENVRRLAAEQFSRNIFAAAMDVVLVVYAVGFLVLSLYQASIIY